MRDNEIDSLHPISNDLITGHVLQGSLGEVLHAELVPFCSHIPVTSSLPHMPVLSLLEMASGYKTLEQVAWTPALGVEALMKKVVRLRPSKKRELKSECVK